MKRRSITSPRGLPRIRSASVRGFNGRRTNPQCRADTVRNRRVNFTQREIDPPLCDDPTASSERHEAAKPQISDAPKTSEYAFFKKLKKDAGCRSSIIREEDGHLRTFEPSGRTEDFSTKFKDNFDKVTSSIHHEKARLNSNKSFFPPQPNALKSPEAAQVIENRHNDITPPFCAKRVKFADENMILSPLAHSSEKSDFTTKFKDNFDKIASSIHHEKARLDSPKAFLLPQSYAPRSPEVAPVIENWPDNVNSPFLAERDKFSDQNISFSPLDHSSEKSGSEDLEGDMFYQKRKRLRQWVTETSGPKVENLLSKGYDLVSALLSRLFPDENQSKYFRDTEAKCVIQDTKYLADEFLHEDSYGEKYLWSRTSNVTKAEPLSYLDDICRTQRETIPLKLDSDLLEDICDWSSHRIKTRDYIKMDHARYLDDNYNETREMIPLNLNTRFPDSSFGCHNHFQYENNKSYFSSDDRNASSLAQRELYYSSYFDGSSSSSRIKEGNKLYALDESGYRRESGIMLLDWDFASSQDKGNLSHTTRDKEMNLLSTWVAPSHDCHLAREPNSIMFNSDWHIEKFSWDPTLHKEDTMMVAEPKQYPIPLTYFPESLEEDHNSYISFEANEGISLQHTNCIVSKFLSEKHPTFSESSQEESLCSYLLTDEQNNLLESSQSNPRLSLCAEDTINALAWPSLDLDMPCRKEMIFPFLLDSNPSWHQSEEDNCYDCD